MEVMGDFSGVNSGHFESDSATKRYEGPLAGPAKSNCMRDHGFVVSVQVPDSWFEGNLGAC